MMSQTFCILVNDNQDVLLRVIGVIMRRVLNIESLTWGKVEEGVNKIKVTISGDEARLSRIALQIEKIIEVISVNLIEE
ncbi:hypothetical protein GC102_26970 [Paenibacillus sp. LMG 31460]|uniref:Acetolactate synthase small subunit-like ACT domain-containing protein n=1 Tax=Paenibacillus germinis TaxID=2654979 RepID=A0ABX1Z7K9_9BACL|nr:ACT domain-containing protein [Paenibacillus germinis]NOU89357.1 hypothetical protein [Paenibacillus germinis]